MPIEMFCAGCGKRMRAPDTAAGKKVRCPECQTISVVPAAGDGPQQPPAEQFQPAPPASPFGNLGGLLDEADGHDYSMSVNLPPVPPPQREVSPYRAPRTAPAPRRSRNDDDDLTAADIALCVLCPNIGCIMSLVYLIQGKASKGGKMMLCGIVTQILWAVVVFAIRVMNAV